MSSTKMPQRYLFTVGLMRKVESRKQGPPAKKAKVDEVLVAHCRADLVTECMKNKKPNIIRFGHKLNFIFVGIFVYGRK